MCVCVCVCVCVFVCVGQTKAKFVREWVKYEKAHRDTRQYDGVVVTGTTPRATTTTSTTTTATAAAGPAEAAAVTVSDKLDALDGSTTTLTLTPADHQKRLQASRFRALRQGPTLQHQLATFVSSPTHVGGGGGGAVQQTPEVALESATPTISATGAATSTKGGLAIAVCHTKAFTLASPLAPFDFDLDCQTFTDGADAEEEEVEPTVDLVVPVGTGRVCASAALSVPSSDDSLLQKTPPASWIDTAVNDHTVSMLESAAPTSLLLPSLHELCPSPVASASTTVAMPVQKLPTPTSLLTRVPAPSPAPVSKPTAIPSSLATFPPSAASSWTWSQLCLLLLTALALTSVLFSAPATDMAAASVDLTPPLPAPSTVAWLAVDTQSSDMNGSVDLMAFAAASATTAAESATVPLAAVASTATLATPIIMADLHVDSNVPAVTESAAAIDLTTTLPMPIPTAVTVTETEPLPEADSVRVDSPAVMQVEPAPMVDVVAIDDTVMVFTPDSVDLPLADAAAAILVDPPTVPAPPMLPAPSAAWTETANAMTSEVEAADVIATIAKFERQIDADGFGATSEAPILVMDMDVNVVDMPQPQPHSETMSTSVTSAPLPASDTVTVMPVVEEPAMPIETIILPVAAEVVAEVAAADVEVLTTPVEPAPTAILTDLAMATMPTAPPPTADAAVAVADESQTMGSPVDVAATVVEMQMPHVDIVAPNTVLEPEPAVSIPAMTSPTLDPYEPSSSTSSPASAASTHPMLVSLGLAVLGAAGMVMTTFLLLCAAAATLSVPSAITLPTSTFTAAEPVAMVPAAHAEIAAAVATPVAAAATTAAKATAAAATVTTTAVAAPASTKAKTSAVLFADQVCT
jgi:hypothetical protein